MLESESRLTELENLMRHVPAAKRSALLKSIADLFLENVDRYRPAQINLFDRLFNQLIAQAGKESAAALARRLARVPNAPVKIVTRLALDNDIAVAEPVLLHSRCIEESVLVDIARAKGQTHLLAIACRPQLAEAIVDLLIARGDEVVVRYVAKNAGAAISQTSAAALVERAKADDALAILVQRRSDIPPHLLADLPRRTPKDSAANAMA
jgi:uncharacterized protein (DUF2336 family)